MISESELQNLQHDHRDDGLTEVNYKMLKKWLNHDNPSYKWLAMALLSIGRRDIIDGVLMSRSA